MIIIRNRSATDTYLGVLMLWKLSSFGGAAVVGLGLVVGGTGPTTSPVTHTADVELSATVLAIGGVGQQTMSTQSIARYLGGRWANEDLVGLTWPGEMAPFNGTLTLSQSVAVGVENMDLAIRNTAGPKIVIGVSGSTAVVNEEMRRLANDSNAPSREEVSFVVMGDADRGVNKRFLGRTIPIFDYTVPAIPETPYDLMVIAAEYDGFGDWPDRSWNLLAVYNALAGTGAIQNTLPAVIVDRLGLKSFGSAHVEAMFADLANVPVKNITTAVNAAGGVTTTYLVPTADLPMLRPLKSWGVQQGVIDTLERVLRPIIDSAYVRNDPIRNGPMSPGPAMRTAAAKPAAASVRAAERKTATKAAKRQAPNSRSTLN